MRNKLAGIFRGNSKTAKYYHEHPEARKKKEEYDTKYHSTPSRRKYRSILGALNRKMGKMVTEKMLLTKAKQE